MNQIYQIREMIISYYKRYERMIFPILKFIASFIIFLFISKMGYAIVLTKLPVGILFGISGMIVPAQWFFLLIIFLVSTHLAFVSVEVAVLVSLFLIIIYLLYIRMFPKQSLLILALLLGFALRIPFVVPLFAGLYVGVSGIIPIAFGTLIWYFIPHIQMLINMKSGELMDIPNVLAKMYVSTIQWVTQDQTAIITIVIFSLAIISVYCISRFSFDYSWYVAIGIGTGINIIGFLVAILILDMDVNILGGLVSNIISMFLMFLVQFMHRVVDYSRAESVQFEDEENYYYVKVIPKIILEKPKREIKRIVQEPNHLEEENKEE
ncbi:MAG: hypothetical protein PWP07_605 [Epulopiscium sp.]|uniref:Uncharacterized protein n=1 Tax=Defluviitalea raffinosedens TaxID=1450156 RepID=A0A7C8HFU7_9FIRM|nr:hypothetical protein [Defluviitalea raffinosedens]MBZ4668344.1 conserved rane protein of unknown function [Defluviitaleaceae bacterium]MDK2787380.1 hypothetical protein [Candidatus Epulonipiscium sp.]KAE9636223.1 hypothetical protein GND95_03640 [Defluviitalea raffinosedens]MBM7684917.1 hypothetical protein [Defluviitalea raffinosedens]HHW66202.1 hypothetical protein [Candidatus Epulonipiscium sp.]